MKYKVKITSETYIKSIEGMCVRFGVKDEAGTFSKESAEDIKKILKQELALKCKVIPDAGEVIKIV